MIKQIHVNECDSTQELLKEQLNANSQGELFVVSCETQLKGRGRGENIWTSLPGTLCFSLNVKPNAIMSFTAIELAVIIAKYFETKNRSLKLKWPNDLWDENSKKCGGILVQGNQNNLMAGIGLNLIPEDPQFGSVFSSTFPIMKKEYAFDLASYIHQHRFQNVEDLKREWLLRCGHLNQMVKITEGENLYEGIFQGIGEHGEATVCVDATPVKIYNGSLRTI